MFRYFFLINIVALTLSIHSFAQDSTVVIIPGEEYKASETKELFLGAHWRKLWTTSIKVKVLNIKSFAGGLTPIKRGGGLQTKSLRFKGNDGQFWKFRSVNKDPSKVLPEEIKETFVSDVVKDQVSAANPVAPLIVAPLLNAVGVLQAIPTLYFLPDDEALGEYREEFANTLGMLEIHPDDLDDSLENFAGARKIVGTYKLLHKLEDNPEQKVDSKEFLKARLIDILVGDWDRHFDQWRWAEFVNDNKKTWLPIPRDRDQAFAKFDGIGPKLIEYNVNQIVSFKKNYSSIKSLTWSGRFLDRRFLSELDKKTWDSVTTFVQNKITDSVIVDAVYHMPKEYIPLAADELIDFLKNRRDHLKEASDDFFDVVNDVIDIFASNKRDSVIVNRLNNYYTDVSVFHLDKFHRIKNNSPYYHKIIINDKTDEVRIHLLDGDDIAIVKGEVDDGPLVRVIGYDGADMFTDSSLVKGHFLAITPFKRARHLTRFYDSGKKSKFIEGPGTEINTNKYPEPKNDFERYESRVLDRGEEWRLNSVNKFNSDDGFILGLGPTYIKYNFRNYPYETWMTFTTSYATKIKSYDFFYEGFFNAVFNNVTLHLVGQYTELSLSNYFGFGNKTSFNSDLEETDFYKVEQDYLQLSPSVIFYFFPNTKTELGLSFNSYDTKLNTLSLINNFPNKFGLGELKFISTNFKFQYDTRDVPRNPFKGSFVEVKADYFPNAIDNDYSFLKSGLDLRTYIPVRKNLILALRAFGQKIWGTFPFFHSAFLGGKETLRGFSRERFAGDASVLFQSELRVAVTNLKILIPGTFGVHFFSEIGRVFADGEDSDKWYPTYGGGIWLAFLKRSANISLTLGKSEDKVSFYLRGRLGF